MLIFSAHCEAVQIPHEHCILWASVGAVTEVELTDLRRPLKNTLFFTLSGAGCLAGDVAARPLFLQLFIDPFSVFIRRFCPFESSRANIISPEHIGHQRAGHVFVASIEHHIMDKLSIVAADVDLILVWRRCWWKGRQRKDLPTVLRVSETGCRLSVLCFKEYQDE